MLFLLTCGEKCRSISFLYSDTNAIIISASLLFPVFKIQPVLSVKDAEVVTHAFVSLWLESWNHHLTGVKSTSGSKSTKTRKTSLNQLHIKTVLITSGLFMARLRIIFQFTIMQFRKVMANLLSIVSTGQICTYMKRGHQCLYTCESVHQLVSCVMLPVRLVWANYGKGPSPIDLPSQPTASFPRCHLSCAFFPLNKATNES